MTTIDPATIDSFGIAIPPGWVRIPLDDGEFELHVRNQRNLLREEQVLSRTAERQFELLMRQLRNDCLKNNVSMLAVLLAALGTDDGDGENGHNPEEREAGAEVELLAVGCTLSVISRADLGVDTPITANILAAALSRSVSTEQAGVRIVTLEAPTVVALPAGDAVRVLRSHRYRSSIKDGDEVAVFVHHVLIPFGRRNDTALVCTFCTPTLGHVESLVALFDEMVATIRFFGGDDVTDPLAAPGPDITPDR